jgi:putative transposase
MKDYTEILQKNISNLRETFSMFSLDKFVVNSIEGLMQVEREEYLKEIKGRDVYDKANGYYSRIFRSLQSNGLVINIPRTRNNTFSPLALELIKLNQDQVNHLALSMYKKGISTRDVKDLLKTCFNESLSATSVNKLAKEFGVLRKAWENEKLDKYYKVVYLDVVFITVKRGNNYQKEGVYIGYGINSLNKRELLILDINPTESASIWEEQLKNIKKKGVERIDLIVSDELTGLNNQVSKIFPCSFHQICVVHKYRNVLRKVRASDKTEILLDLKEVFNNFESSNSIENAKLKLYKFLNKWKLKYPFLRNCFKTENINNYFAYLNFPAKVRRFIYTNNSIENLNKQIRKATKNKLSFENPNYLLDFVFIVIKDFEDKLWKRYPLSIFNHFDIIKEQKER